MTLTLGTATATAPLTLSGTIADGAGTVSLTSNVNVTLSGANSYTGGTTVDTGATLNLTNNAAAGTNGITLQPGSTLGLNNVAITNMVSGSGDPNINVTGASSMPTYTGAAGTTFNILGTDNSATTDVLTVTTANATYAGTTNVGGTAAGSSVTLTGGAANAFGSTSMVSVFTGSVLNLGGFGQTIGSLSGAGTVTDSGGAATLTIGGGTATTFSGAITGMNTALMLSNAGTGLTLSGSGNTYGGATTISGGSLMGGATNAFSSGSATTISGGTLNLGGFSDTITNVSLAGGTISNGNLTAGVTSTGGTISANLVGASTLTNTSGTTTLSGTTPNWATTINGGTLALLGAAASRLRRCDRQRHVDISGCSTPQSHQDARRTRHCQLGGNSLVTTAGSAGFSGSIERPVRWPAGRRRNADAFRCQHLHECDQINTGATLALKGNGSIANSAYVGFLGAGTLDVSQTNGGTTVGALFGTAGNDHARIEHADQ